MKFIRIIAIVILALDSCIEPFNEINLNIPDVFVVDGEITDQPGPYTVSIFKPREIPDQLNELRWVPGAAVSFLDENGNEDAVLHEISPGIYQTDSSYRGVVGKSYQLRFTTNDGDEYRSTIEKLNPVGDIDSMYFQFIEDKPFEYNFYYDQKNTTNGFNIMINSRLLPEQGGLVRWRWHGIFGIVTYPEQRTKTDPDAGIALPDPPRCSGRAKDLQYLFPCTCCHCWVTQYSQAVTLSDQKFVNNDAVLGQFITRIPASPRNLFDKYYLVVEQMSVSQTVYNFWKKVAEQQNNSSNLFQTPPPPTGGNIQTISGKIPALGIFSASAIKKKSLVFTKQDVPYYILPIDTIKNTCLAAWEYGDYHQFTSTTTKPPFW